MTLPRTQRQWHLLGPERVELREVPLEPPRGEELLVRIEAATTCGTDLKVYRRGGHPRMLRAPCPFGHEMAGVIAASGSDQRLWREGERVVIANSAPCGECRDCARGRFNLCSDLEYLNGAFAEYVLVPERFARRSVYRIPDHLTPEIAALTEPLACAVRCVASVERFLAKAEATGPPTVIVYGAGPLGLLLVALLAERRLDVACADPNPGRLVVARSFGAAIVVEIGRRGGSAPTVLAAAEPMLDVERFDLAIDATGAPEVWLDAAASVRPGGQVVFFGGTAAGVEISIDAQRLHYGELTLAGVFHHRPDDFARALDHLARKTAPFETLLSERRPLGELEAALGSMIARTALKVALSSTVG